MICCANIVHVCSLPNCKLLSKCRKNPVWLVLRYGIHANRFLNTLKNVYVALLHSNSCSFYLDIYLPLACLKKSSFEIIKSCILELPALVTDMPHCIFIDSHIFSWENYIHMCMLSMYSCTYLCVRYGNKV